MLDNSIFQRTEKYDKRGSWYLAYLYACLTDFARSKHSKNLCGCMSLIQVWCHEHFYIGRPVTSTTSDIEIFSLAIQWTTYVVDQHHHLHKVIRVWICSVVFVVVVDGEERNE
ncbi:ribosomal protein S3 [Iris pallida]|uniref:Ribosomal protein S3 (Mitochondrion) n=1 Tax=Iris pallida TaxID=29817 RepID=A0AAX6GP86_IRIPA|nr:ribosomal protein S3 [Iris pallida]